MKKQVKSKQEIITETLIVKSKLLPYTWRMEWCLANDISLSTLHRYLNGQIASFIIAEKLLADIEAYIKQNNLVDAA